MNYGRWFRGVWPIQPPWSMATNRYTMLRSATVEPSCIPLGVVAPDRSECSKPSASHPVPVTGWQLVERCSSLARLTA